MGYPEVCLTFWKEFWVLYCKVLGGLHLGFGPREGLWDMTLGF